MKIDTDKHGRLVIEPTGEDSPIVNGIPQGMILVMRDATVIEVWERDGAITMRTTKEDECSFWHLDQTATARAKTALFLGRIV